jgi:hypothetical protein
MCSPECQHIKTHWDVKAKQTAEHGCIPVAAVSSKKGLGVTVTSGSSGLNFPELNHILSATQQLLKVFRFDTQADETPVLDSDVEVPMLKGFVHGSHAMSCFNHSCYALTLWENVPREGPVSLQVLLPAHAAL